MSDDVGPGDAFAVWTVEVWFGAPVSEDEIAAPMTVSDTMTVLLGDDGVSEGAYQVGYGPVCLHGDSATELRIQVPVKMTQDEFDERMKEHGSVNVGFDTVRRLLRPVISFDVSAGTELEVRGMEVRSDGTLIDAMWSIRPFTDPR